MYGVICRGQAQNQEEGVSVVLPDSIRHDAEGETFNDDSERSRWIEDKFEDFLDEAREALCSVGVLDEKKGQFGGDSARLLSAHTRTRASRPGLLRHSLWRALSGPEESSGRVCPQEYVVAGNGKGPVMSVERLLNRLLGIKVEMQERVFEYFGAEEAGDLRGRSGSGGGGGFCPAAACEGPSLSRSAVPYPLLCSFRCRGAAGG